MAHLLQALNPGLALLASLPLVAAEAQRPFSHRLHLKLNLECLSCHSIVESSTRLEDNNLPARKVCLPCHEQVNIRAPSPSLLARFDHRQHLRLGNLAPAIRAAIDSKAYLSPSGEIRRHLNTGNRCSACHRGLEESDSAGRSVFPQMADCLVCHPKIDPPFSCEFCHRAAENLKPESHTPDYLDLHGSGRVKLDKPSCAVCHGRRFTCLGCH